MSETTSRTGPVTVGLDIGTTSVKAVTADETGTILARARIPHRLVTSPPGTFEHDANHAWRTDVIDALRQVAGTFDVRGVAVSAMVPSCAAVDANGHALTPGLLYGDRRGFGGPPLEPALADLPGDGGEVLSFVAWLAVQAPDAHGYWPAQAVANHALSGDGFIDTFTATTSFPLFDLTRWDPDRARTCSIEVDRLARVVGECEAGGTVQGDLPAGGAVVAGGTVDGYAEQIMSGAEQVGDVLVICGSTLIIWCLDERWRSAPGLWSVPHQQPGWCQLGGPSNAGGLFQDRVAHLTGVDPMAAGRMPVTDPVEIPIWLPYVRGERTPLHRRDLRASLHDVGMHHGPAEVIRAAQEAAGFVVRRHLELAREAGCTPRRIVATGGGTRSAGLMQALADTTGLTVEVAAHPEGAALGAAYLARCAAGLEDGLARASEWARLSHRIEPSTPWLEACARRYERFEQLSDAATTTLGS